MKEEIKVGDRVLVRRLFSIISRNPFHITIRRTGRDLFGDYFYGSYHYTYDFGGGGNAIDKFRRWHVLYKD